MWPEIKCTKYLFVLHRWLCNKFSINLLIFLRLLSTCSITETCNIIACVQPPALRKKKNRRVGGCTQAIFSDRVLNHDKWLIKKDWSIRNVFITIFSFVLQKIQLPRLSKFLLQNQQCYSVQNNFFKDPYVQLSQRVKRWQSLFLPCMLVRFR